MLQTFRRFFDFFYKILFHKLFMFPPQPDYFFYTPGINLGLGKFYRKKHKSHRLIYFGIMKSSQSIPFDHVIDFDAFKILLPVKFRISSPRKPPSNIELYILLKQAPLHGLRWNRYILPLFLTCFEPRTRSILHPTTFSEFSPTKLPFPWFG